jgi:predicted RNase H-like HicB family nuclease
MREYTYTAIVEYDPETRLYVGSVPALPGAYTQGASLDELHANLEEVVRLVLEDQESRGEVIMDETFVGLQRIAVTA